MRGCVVNVATGYFVKGQDRLRKACSDQDLLYWTDSIPLGSPAHTAIPYAFKAFALAAARARGYKLLLWADSCIVPIQPIGRLFDRIEIDGYWISRNGWMNSEWTADSAYPDLGISRAENELVPHVVATAFGINLDREVGCALLDEYFRLAKTRAFCGPWRNSPETPCGDSKVFGHRHDQTALSVIAWKLGLKLTDPPDVFAYKGGESCSTILVADGNY